MSNPSKNTIQLHRLLQDLLSKYHAIPDHAKHGNYGRCLSMLITQTRMAAINSEDMDEDKSYARI
jgi:hypothetical protein